MKSLLLLAVDVFLVSLCGFALGFESTEKLDWARITPFQGCEQDLLPFQILVPGHFSASELPPNPGGHWFALTHSGSEFRLSLTDIRLRPIDNPRATGDLSVPGVSVESDIPDSVLFFIRGSSGLSEGAVRAWLPARVRLAPAGSVTLQGEGAHRWELLTTSLPPTRYEGIPQMYRLRIRDREIGRAQDLGGWVSASSPSAEWVGDLDGDGRLDLLLLDDTSEAGSRLWTLFLSSHAAGKDLVGRSAEFSTPGC